MNPEPLTNEPELSIGVVLYQNAGEELQRLVRSIELAERHPEAPSSEINWIDNSPTGMLRGIFDSRGESLRYRYSGANLGFGAAQNILMHEAFATGARAYACINPDAILHPDCLANLWKEARRHPRLGLVEAMQFPDEHPKRYDPASHETPWCSGCVLMITRECYRGIGGFDPRFFMYCEDVDLSWRARAEGFSVCVAPSALAHHYVGDRRAPTAMILNMLRSGVMLGAKYGNEPFFLHCLSEYRALHGVEFDVPSLERPAAPLKAVSDFSRMFHFAEARW